MIGYMDSRSTDKTNWSYFTFGFIFVCVTQLILGVLSCFIPFFSSKLSNITSQTIYNYEAWRPFTTIFSPIVDQYTVINLVCALLVLSQFAPALEKKYSTIYFLTEIFLQNLLCNLVFTIIAFFLLKLGVSQQYLIGYGLWPLVLIYSWKSVAENPNQPATFCWIPYIVPYRRIPLIFLGIQILYLNQMPLLIVAFSLGYLQSMVLKRTIFRLPLQFYKTAEKLFLPCFRSNNFVKVDSVQQNLRPQCCVCQCQLKFPKFTNNSSNFQGKVIRIGERKQKFVNPFDENIQKNNTKQLRNAQHKTVTSTYLPKIVEQINNTSEGVKTNIEQKENDSIYG